MQPGKKKKKNRFAVWSKAKEALNCLVQKGMGIGNKKRLNLKNEKDREGGKPAADAVVAPGGEMANEEND